MRAITFFSRRIGVDLVYFEPIRQTLFHKALFDGEDFELLFTVRAEDADALDFQCLEDLEQKFQRIGTITAQPEILTLDGTVLERKAFEHFTSK